jgi:hypothetical protein
VIGDPIPLFHGSTQVWSSPELTIGRGGCGTKQIDVMPITS